MHDFKLVTNARSADAAMTENSIILDFHYTIGNNQYEYTNLAQETTLQSFKYQSISNIAHSIASNLIVVS